MLPAGVACVPLGREQVTHPARPSSIQGLGPGAGATSAGEPLFVRGFWIFSRRMKLVGLRTRLGVRPIPSLQQRAHFDHLFDEIFGPRVLLQTEGSNQRHDDALLRLGVLFEQSDLVAELTSVGLVTMNGSVPNFISHKLMIPSRRSNNKSTCAPRRSGSRLRGVERQPPTAVTRFSIPSADSSSRTCSIHRFTGPARAFVRREIWPRISG